MSTRHKHRWQRLSDTALFCECGETKAVSARGAHICPQPFVIYPPVVVPTAVPQRPYWQWPNTTWPTITVGGTTQMDMTGITVWNGSKA